MLKEPRLYKHRTTVFAPLRTSTWPMTLQDAAFKDIKCSQMAQLEAQFGIEKNNQDLRFKAHYFCLLPQAGKRQLSGSGQVFLIRTFTIG
jgi:hypothetical protein